MRPALKFPPTVIGLYSVLGKHVVREPHLNLGDNKIGGGGGGVSTNIKTSQILSNFGMIWSCFKFH